MNYNLADCYWLVSNNLSAGVFSSSRGIYVPSSDAAYLAWLASNVQPRTILNEQELLVVLAQQAPGAVMQTPSGLAAYANAKQTAIMAGGISVNIGTVAWPQLVKCGTDVGSLVLLQGAQSMAAANATATFNWVQSNGVSVTLTAAQIITIFNAVTAFLQATFTTLSQVLQSISAGTIKTRSAVDSPPTAWPVNS